LVLCNDRNLNCYIAMCSLHQIFPCNIANYIYNTVDSQMLLPCDSTSQKCSLYVCKLFSCYNAIYSVNFMEFKVYLKDMGYYDSSFIFHWFVWRSCFFTYALNFGMKHFQFSVWYCKLPFVGFVTKICIINYFSPMGPSFLIKGYCKWPVQKQVCIRYTKHINFLENSHTLSFSTMVLWFSFKQIYSFQVYILC
jgi:hypothetical protein